MINISELLSKRDLARHFGVSLVTVHNWVTKGCPVAIPPDGSFAARSMFDLAAVREWRSVMAGLGRPQGGAESVETPLSMARHPEWASGARFLAEQSVRSYLYHWCTAPDAGPATLAMLQADFGGDASKARRAFDLVFLGLFEAFGGWLADDDLDQFLREHGHGGFDALWHQWTGQAVETAPPVEKESMTLLIPSWMLEGV